MRFDFTQKNGGWVKSNVNYNKRYSWRQADKLSEILWLFNVTGVGIRSGCKKTNESAVDIESD